MLILERDRKEYINAVIYINLLILHVLGISSHFLNSNSLDLCFFFSNKIKHVILERSREFKSWKNRTVDLHDIRNMESGNVKSKILYLQMYL